MSVSFANRRMLSLRQNKRSSFPGHAPGKDTLRAANAATKVGVNGGENARTSFLRSEGVCSPVKIKFPVASADMRRHSDTLRGANATTKTRFTGRKQNKRKRILLSSRRSPKGGLTGENARANAVSGRALSPVLICLFVKTRICLFPDMRREKTP